MVSVGDAQTPAHQHPVMPPPKPAGPTPASGSTASPGGTEAPKISPDHAGMNPPASHAGHAGMSMPMGQGHQMPMAFGPFADAQDASGTAWQPEATPMHAHHSMTGAWGMMTHYNIFLGYNHQSGPRGADQFNAINWLMLMATQRSGESELMFRGMFTLEPWPTTAKGYPLLLAAGETADGVETLVDRQHPHDFFMELATRYRRLVNPDTALMLYVAPSGEPALGPPAFMHRMSAADNPAAPISHHWLDSTHISFGVLTAGIARKAWQLEGSWFNGREPDEDRWDIEPPHLDSYAGRFTWNPTPQWSAQISHGYLKSPEELHPREHVRRTTASVMNTTRLGPDSHRATTLAWGRNDHDMKTNAVLLETSCTNGRTTCFGRAEYVQKSGEELGLKPLGLGRGPGVLRRKFGIKQLTLGASRELVAKRPWQMALGGSVTYAWKSDELDVDYGRHPVGFWFFLRLRPAAMAH